MDTFSRRLLLVALLACGALHVASLLLKRIEVALPGVAAHAEGTFVAKGEYEEEPYPAEASIRRWGSWSGSDSNQGRLTLGPFPAPKSLRFYISGYPTLPGNDLYVELASGEARVPILAGSPGERWRPAHIFLPPAWRGKPVRLVAVDGDQSWGGWLALSEPITGGRGDPAAEFTQTLAAWGLNGLLFLALSWTAAPWVRRIIGANCAPHWVPLLATALVATAGYALFWLYFLHSSLGKAASLGLMVFAVVCWRRRDPLSAATRSEMHHVGVLVALIGALYIGILYLFCSPFDFYELSARRFGSLPADNHLPHIIATRLNNGMDLREPLGDWRSSDRPPLQVGWQLLTAPVFSLLRSDPMAATGTAAVWLELTWVAAAYGLLRWLGLPRHRALLWTALLALTGFFLLHTVYTWPKLPAAAFTCGAFGLWFSRRLIHDGKLHAAGGALAGLAWLAHGSAAFSLLALAPFAAWRCLRGEWRAWVCAAAAFTVLALPWLAYQKLHDPPGNRLLKWHLGGQLAVDARGTWETLRASYAALSAREIWRGKAENFATQIEGRWSHSLSLSPSGAATRRDDEFRFTARGLTWWLVGLALVPFAMLRARHDAARSPPTAKMGLLAAWALGTVVLWCLLMFIPGSTIVHQGSLAAMLTLFVLAAAGFEAIAPWMAGVATLLAPIPFALTWAAPSATVNGPLHIGALLLVLTGLAAAVAGVAWTARHRGTEQSESTEEPVAAAPRWATTLQNLGIKLGTRTGLREWWQQPTLTWWAVLAIAGLLFLRKPHALLTPQLWAEDGAIFLAFNELDGVGAWKTPYMGYLHVLPRIIAWLAPQFADPAWWPAFYNGAAFLIWVAVIARLFSPRLELPAKPWLALTFIMGPQTGEVLFNITNLQWLTAFVLVQQALIRPAANTTQRVTDFALVALVGLTGPFIIPFSLLFAWRWWRQRTVDNFALLALAGGCACVQAFFVYTTGPKFDYQSAPFHLFANIIVLARRILVWPVCGPTLALALPPAFIGIVGGGLLAGVVAWALRPHPRRELRAVVLVAFVLMVLVGVARTRPDTWAADNLYYGDRYFFIPRILLAWLVVWEFDAAPRAIAWTARLLCLAAVLAHLPTYRVPAPPNLHWERYVEPIRQGVRTEIPILPEGFTFEYRGRKGPPR